MKTFLVLIAVLFSSQFAFAIDPYNFTCDQSGVITQSLPGLKKAPESPVVSLNIKVLTAQVKLFLIKASVSTGGEKNLFATDWASPTLLSQDGKDLMNLLSLFFNVKVDTLVALRAALPTDLLDGFAYLELKDQDGSVMKLGFQGSTPTVCQ